MPARDPWFDNAKMLLVTLVVVGHSLVMLLTTTFHCQLYDFLYLWHMPAFVLITGFLSRGFTYTRKRVWSLVRGLLVPYLIIEGLLALFRTHAGGEHFSHLWIEPHWPLWYLPALIMWRLATPVIRRLNWWALPIAIAVSMAGGYITTLDLQLTRVAGFLPFYVLGVLLTPQAFEKIRTLPARALGIAGLVGVWVFASYTDTWGQTRWLYYSWSYRYLDAVMPSPVMRLCLLLVGTVGALAVLSLIPRRDGWFARMGASSLIVYLCHGFFIKGVEYSPYPDWAVQHDVLSVLVNVTCAVSIALLLASPPVARLLGWAVDPLTNADGEVDEAIALHVRADRLQERPPMSEQMGKGQYAPVS